MSDGAEDLSRSLHVLESTVAQGFTEENWRGTIEYLESKHLEYFESETSPAGEQWAPLSAVTITAKGHATKLIESGEMVESVANSGAPSAIRRTNQVSLEFGTSREFAGVHQEGSDKVPQREFVGADEQAMDEIGEIIADAFQMMIDERLPQ